MDEEQFNPQANLGEETTAEPIEWPTDEVAEQGAEVDETAGGEEDASFEIDGKTYKASDLRAFIKGGMLEKDYRQKTSVMAREREQLAPLRQAAEAWQTVYSHPKLRQVVASAIADVLQGKEPVYGGATAPAETEPELPFGGNPEVSEPWKPELQKMQDNVSKTLGTLDDRFKAYEKYQWDAYYAAREQHARANIPALQAKFPYLYPEEIIAVFKEQQEADLEQLAKESHEHWYQFYQDRQKADLTKRKENAKARVDAGAARGGAPATQTVEPGDWDGARRSAMERLRKVGGLFKQ